MTPKVTFPVIVAVAFALRVWGLAYGLPHLYHQDEPIVVNHALAIGATGWDTGRYMPPQFASYFLFLLYGAFFVLGKFAGSFKDSTDFALHFFRDPTAFYLIGRFFLGAVFGTATVALLYRTTERFFSASAAPLAALVLAVLPLHVQHSHYLYMDAAVTFAMLLFHLLFAWFEAPSAKSVMLAGAAFGFAVSVKYTAAYFAPVAALSFLLFAGNELSWPRRFGHAVLLGSAALVTYALISPYSFLHWGDFLKEVRQQSQWRAAFDWGFHLKYSINEASGFLFLPLALLGSFVIVRDYGRKGLILASAAVLYYAVNICFTQPYPRYMMPILPALCLFAVLGLNFFGRGKRFVLVLLLAELMPVSAYADWQMTQKDTRTQAAEWILKNVPPGTAIAVDSRAYGPHLDQTEAVVREKMAGEEGAAKHKRYELLLETLKDRPTYATYLLNDAESDDEGIYGSRPLVELDKAALRRRGVRFVVKNYLERGVDGGSPKHRFIDSLGAQTPVASFSPYRVLAQKWEQDSLIGTTCQPHRRSDLFARTRPGPYLEIYELKDDF